MAGMLPGVESARRRRFRPGGSFDSPSGSRRSSFGLYTTSHDTSMRSALSKGLHSGALGNIAREAKERLDERLRSQQQASQIKRYNSTGSMTSTPAGDGAGAGGGVGRVSGEAAMPGNLQREVFCPKRRSRKFSWSKMGWRALEQTECVVCIEDFKRGDMLVHLPCAHRFHWSCVVPWLESNSHCPCCRTTILSN